jgi:hypothetical protein
MMNRRLLLAIFMVFIVSLSFRLWDIKATGGTWDEDIYFTSGWNFINNLYWRNFTPEDWGWNFEHPPVSKYIYGIGARLSFKFPDDPAFRSRINYSFSRMESAGLGALTCVVALLLGWEFFSPSVGILAASLLTFLPQFVAYGKLISLESPQAFFTTTAVYLFLKGIKAKGNSKFYLLAGLFAGLAGGTRYNAYLVIPLLGLIYVLARLKGITEEKGRSVPINVVLIPFIAVGLVFLIWPWMWENTVPHLLKSINYSRHEHFHKPDYIYYWRYFFAMTPALLIFSFGGFLWKIFKEKSFELLSVLLWFLFPIAVLSAFGVYDGNIRYVLDIYPPFTIASAVGFFFIADKIVGRFKKIKVWRKQIVAAGGFLLVAYVTFAGLTVRPYYMDYYGELVGGVGGVLKRGLDYGHRGEGIKEAIDFVNKDAPSGSVVKVVAIPNEAPPLRADLKPFGEGDHTNYYVYLPPWLAGEGGMPLDGSYELRYEVKVAGVLPLAAVYREKK